MELNDLRETFKRLNLEVIGDGHSGNVKVSCPLSPWRHAKLYDRRPSMSVKISLVEPSLAHCFACEWAGPVTRLLEELNYRTKNKHAQLLRDVRALERPNPARRADRALQHLAEMRAPAPSVGVFDEALLEPFAGGVPKYLLQQRRLELGVLKDWEVGFDTAAQRAVFPVRDFEANLVGMYGRSVVGRDHYHYWNWPKSQYLYGEHRIHLRCDRVVVVEGVIDALWLWQQGVRPPAWNVVALFGSTPSDAQLTKLRRIGQRVIVMLDGDQQGRAGAAKLVRGLDGKLPRGVGISRVDLPDDVDPSDLNSRDLWAALAEMQSTVEQPKKPKKEKA